MYSTRILKSRYISVVEPVTIDTEIEEFEVTELEENEFLEEEQQDPENVAADIIAKAREEAVAILEEYQRQLEEMKQKHEQEMEEYRKEVEKTA